MPAPINPIIGNIRNDTHGYLMEALREHHARQMRWSIPQESFVARFFDTHDRLETEQPKKNNRRNPLTKSCI